MTLAFRPSNAADAEAIAELCTRVLSVPAQSPVFSRAHMQWKYWDDWPFWRGSRSFLLLSRDRPVAHAGVVPLRFSSAGRTHTLVQLIDWAADPNHVGAGAVLLRRIVGLADGAMSVRGSSMTRRMLKPLGFRALGETTRYAAPAGRPARHGRLALARDATVTFHERGRFAAREHPLNQAESSAERLVFQRCAAQIQVWLGCPVAPARYAEVSLGDQMFGSFVLCRTPGQVRIADIWADEQLEHAWEAVVSLAYEHGAQEAGATEVVCQTNDPAQASALQACGFVAAGSDPLAILVSPRLAPTGAVVRHQLLDSDLGYLHHGTPESWLG